MRLTRYFMYKRIAACLKEPLFGSILGISGIEDIKFIVDCKNSKIVEAHYPDVDMEHLPYKDESFDYVISDQIIEHLENPWKAIAESHRVLKKSGIAIHTTCFMNYFHPAPKDFWRFSPDALRSLCKEFTEVLQCDGWGNRMALLLCFLGDKFRAMEIPDAKFSVRRLVATYNENRYPISSWIIARK